MITGYFYILSAASCWGLIGIVSQLPFSQGLDSMEIAFWRALLAWPFFAVQAFSQKELRIEIRDIPFLCIFAVLGISLFYIFYLYAVKTAGAAFAAVLLYTAPAWVVLCSIFIYRERLTVIKAAVVGLVMLGVFLISQTGSDSNDAGSPGVLAILAGLGSGFCYSLYYTIGKYFSSRYSSANLFMYLLPLGALGILPFVDFVHKTPLAWAGLICLAFLSTFIANYCYYKGLVYLEAGRASIVATVEPVVAAVFAYIILGEYFTLWGYFGAVLILAAVLVTICKK